MSFNHVTEADLKYFRELLPGRVFSGEEISTDYDHDEMTIYGHYMPEAVLQALTTEDVSAVLKYCNEHNIAVTPRGAGTGLCGGCVAINGGVERVHILDGRIPHSILIELLSDRGIGTMLQQEK